MRDVDNLYDISTLEPSDSVIVLEELPVFNIPDYDLFDDKQFKKYLDRIEKIVRNSDEYRRYIAYLRDVVELNECSFYENVTNINTYKIKIEIHHDPLTLFDLANIVFRKRSAMMESIDEEDVAKEIVYIHYLGVVGLIPLATTIHELVHNNFLFVPTTKVLGNYRAFVEYYKEYFTDEQSEYLQKIEELSSEVEREDYKTLLAKNYITVDPNGSYVLPSLDKVIERMTNRIQELLNPITIL